MSHVDQRVEDINEYLSFRYFKLLIQEFAICADQGLIVSLLAFIKSETVCFFFSRYLWVICWTFSEFGSANNPYGQGFEAYRQTTWNLYQSSNKEPIGRNQNVLWQYSFISIEGKQFCYKYSSSTFTRIQNLVYLESNY